MDRRLGLGPNTLEGLVWPISYCCERQSLVFYRTLTLCTTQADLASRPSLAKIPMSLRRVDGHATWTSRAALRLTLAQLPGQKWPSNEEIDGGEIVRGADGNPSGEYTFGRQEILFVEM